MKKIHCKICGCVMFHEYTALEGSTTKFLIKLEQEPSENCNKSIYLTCENNHTAQYYCEIGEIYK